jgi:CRISPR/Cas system-associated protein endoribonuclease Cas2
VVPDVGFAIVAENCMSTAEYTRMLSVVARIIRVELSDHRHQVVEDKNSGGSVTARTISSERVARMISLVGKTVAMYAPFGLGKH